MYLNRILTAGVCVCIALPVWAEKTSKYEEVSLSISTNTVQKSDPFLQAFIQQVWKESPAIKAALAAVNATQARVEGATKPLHNPSIGIETEQTDNNTSIISYSQTIDWNDKQEVLARIASYEKQTASFELLKVRQQISVEALAALVQYYTARERQVLALKRNHLMKEFVDIVKQRQAAGDVAILDVTLAQVAYSEALMLLAEDESKQVEAEAALQAVSDQSKSHWPQLPDELIPPPDRADPILLQSLPGLILLQKRFEAARTRINLAERETRIDPTFSIQVGHEGSESLIGLSIEIPLFVRNDFNSSVQEASYEANIEEQTYHEAYRRALAQLNGAHGRYKRIINAWRNWIATGQQAHREQMTLVEKQWQAGDLNTTDFLTHTKQNLDTQARAISLMGEVWRAAIAWLDASGQVEDWLGLTENTIKLSFGE